MIAWTALGLGILDSLALVAIVLALRYVGRRAWPMLAGISAMFGGSSDGGE